MGGKKLYDTRNITDLKDMLKQSAQLFGDKTAFKLKVCKEPLEYKNISYQQFFNDVNNLGTALLNLGLKDETINIISDNRYEWAVSYLAVANGVGIVAPLDKALTSNEIKSLVERSYSQAVIFSEHYLETMLEIMQEPDCRVKFFICMDNVDNPNIINYSELIQIGMSSIENGNTDYINAKINADKFNILLFTSGTTTQSKAVMLSHKNIVTNIMDCRKYLNVNDTDTTLSFLPLHHTFECTANFLLIIYSGATITYCDGIRYLARNITEYGVSLMTSVPIIFESMYKRMVKTIQEKGKWDMVQKATMLFNGLEAIGINTFELKRKAFKDIYSSLSPNLRLFVSGGAAISKDVVKGYNDLGIYFFQGYGLTETSPVIACENEKNRKPGSVGQPLPECEVEIRNVDNLGVGEIWVKAPYVMLGYYHNREETAKVLQDGWFNTGDLGYLDKSGLLYIQGRKKNVIVLKNGKNIFPEELEDLLNTSNFILESMVYGRPDKKGDLDICAKIVYDKHYIIDNLGNIDDKEINKIIKKEIKNIHKNIPAYKYIKDFTLTDVELIKTTTKKIKRHEELKSMGIDPTK